MNTILISLTGMAALAAAVVEASSAPASSGGSPQHAAYSPATERLLVHDSKHLGPIYLLVALGVTVLIFVYVSITKLNRHVRHLTSMTDSQGPLRYYATSSPLMRGLKKNLLYSPILHHRRAHELKLSQYIKLGTLPTRLQAIFILLIIIVNIAICTWGLSWSGSDLDPLPIIRNRSGVLSVANMMPLLIMATVKNPMIGLLDISYDSFNLMHRWLGRLAAIEAIVHSICWMIGKVGYQGWDGVKFALQQPFIYNGAIGAVAMILLLLHSPKMVRSWAYEVFLHAHIAFVLVLIIFLWFHLSRYTARWILLAAACIWGVSRVWRLGTLMWRSLGKGGCKAEIEPLGAGAVRITLTPPRPLHYRIGQYVYLTIPSVGLWTAHPFSIAWSGLEQSLDRSGSVRSEFNEKRPINRQTDLEVEQRGRPTLCLLAKAHTGFTKKLLNRALASETKLTLNAYIEGPYGVSHSLDSYGTVMLFASGVGITHQIGYVRHLVDGYANGTVAAKRITLVWVIPDMECVDWIRPWMQEILGMDRRRDILKVLIYVTRAGLSASIQSPSQTTRMSRGRPNVLDLIQTEADRHAGCMAISVCAGGGLADEVRRASRIMIDGGANIDFIEEGFGW
ncbi:hypothetical protein PV10_08785 [Exophiala mesophila]|uniref:ferric-chelate reductase (NADPH) n=1 Tax=Exophiala mesophila TaxID=212818 RepID=A0A0D1Z353_EXOME|nr:uncharacterized protein PV10_08785 [Exophiala mesophila]KIV89197.1 hypothetical protein PV10_08785 [Exophiala mesophila]